jgi:POT family proton-dependent oligopeptide transporter
LNRPGASGTPALFNPAEASLVTATAEGVGARDARSFFGHPGALATLFMTEMWERFSYYGMHALLVLYLVAAPAQGGLGLGEATANALYGVYGAMIYMTALPGGWVADRMLGARRSVLWGGVVIAAGHFTMAVPSRAAVFIGLTLIVIGTGLLKPNISTMVGALYGRDDPRRDAGFSLFYFGVNLGAFLAPLVCGTLGQKVNWHLGFAAAGVGMTLGLIQYVAGGRRLGQAGGVPTRPLDPHERATVLRRGLLALLGLAAVVAVALFTGVLTLDRAANALTVVAALVAVGYFARIMLDRRLSDVERSRMRAYVWLFVFAAAFWLIYDQAGSVLNLFAEQHVNRRIDGFTFPASWLQSVNPIMIMIGAPLFAILWVKAGNRISTPVKFALGLIFNGLSFALMAAAAQAAVGGAKASPLWLIAVFAVQVCGELALSPVGLSVTTKLAPAAYMGQMLGLWFLAVAVGDAVGGQVARLTGSMPLPAYFLTFGLASVALGVAAVALGGHIRRLMAGIH